MSTEDIRISEPLVMKSAAGYYVGLQYFCTKTQMWQPYDQLTDFVGSEHEGELLLEGFTSIKLK